MDDNFKGGRLGRRSRLEFEPLRRGLRNRSFPLEPAITTSTTVTNLGSRLLYPIKMLASHSADELQKLLQGILKSLPYPEK